MYGLFSAIPWFEAWFEGLTRYGEMRIYRTVLIPVKGQRCTGCRNKMMMPMTSKTTEAVTVVLVFSADAPAELPASHAREARPTTASDKPTTDANIIWSLNLTRRQPWHLDAASLKQQNHIQSENNYCGHDRHYVRQTAVGKLAHDVLATGEQDQGHHRNRQGK